MQDLVISSDSQKVVTVEDDPQVRIWDIHGQEILPGLEQPKNNKKLMRVTMTSDSNYIAAATDSEAKDVEVIIWEVKTGKIINTLQFPHINSTPSITKYAFRDLKFSVDGKFLAAASTDNTIKVWQWQTNKTPQILIGHQDWAYSLSFSQDGKWLVSGGGGSDKSIKIWQIKNDLFKLAKTIEKAHNSGLYVAFNPNNHQLATSGSGDRLLKIWDFDRIINHPNAILNINDFANIILTTIAGNQSEYKGISYSSDGNRMAIPGIDSVTIWEPDRALEKNISASELGIKRVVYSNSGKNISTAGTDNKIRIWRADGTLLQTISGHKDWIFGLNFSPDDQLIASASEDNTVRIWQVADGKSIRILKHDNHAYDVIFSPDSRYLVSVGNDGKLKIWHSHSGQLFQEFKILNNDHWIWRVAFSPDGKYLATNTSSGIEIRRTSDFIRVRTLSTKKDDKGKSENILKISFSPDSKTIASSGADKMIRLWNVEDGKSLVEPYQGHHDAIDDIQFSPDSQEIATTSGGDGQIKFWSRTKQLRRTIEGFKGQSLAYSPDGTTFVAVDGDGVMKFWNLAKLERKYLTLDESYAKGCKQLEEYLSHRQRSKNSQEEASIDSICQH